jgi:RNA polymerase sigma-70 factor, ECF subfamily
LIFGYQDDYSLVEVCRAGQSEAFGVLVRRYQDRLYPTIARLMGSPEDAQDLLQDSFLRAFEKLEQFHGECSFYTWIYRIALNLALSGYRKRRSRGIFRLMQLGKNRPAFDPIDESPQINPPSAVQQAERGSMVEAALNALGPEYCAVVILKDFDGRRYEEISALLNIPLGTVRSRLHRACCELRDRLRSLVDEKPPARHLLRQVAGVLDA